MAKAKPKVKTADTATADSFKNFISRVGVGTGNQSDGGYYGFNPITRNRIQMEFVYRGSWIVGRMIDVVAKDMTRAGVEIITTDAPDKIADFEKELSGLRVWDQLCQTIKWARLYGGAVAFMMIDGQDPSTPLRMETIHEGQFKGLLPMDRWLLNPSLENLIVEYGPQFGKPMFYETTPDTMGMPKMKVHHSRLLRFEGVELPYWQRISENLWGQSVLERLWDRLLAFDSTTSGVAQLVYKAHLRTYSVENLREIIATGGAAMKGLMAQLAMIQTFQTNEGITLLDSNDKFETHTYTFSGLDSVLMQLGEQLAGATEIPLVRLFGQSPAGFSTGETDLRAYYDGINTAQVATLAPGIETLYHVAYLSKFGTVPPKTFALKFKPLWQMTDEQKATAANASAIAINTVYESQIITRSTALKELKQQSHVTGVFTNISDEEIKEAEGDPAPTPEMLGLEAPPLPPVVAPVAPKALPAPKAKASDSLLTWFTGLFTNGKVEPNEPSIATADHTPSTASASSPEADTSTHLGRAETSNTKTLQDRPS